MNTIRMSTVPAVVIHRASLKAERLVYLALANKKLKYRLGSSRIAYIGTTKNGASRIAQSAAAKVDILYDWGVSSLEFYVVTCTPIKRVKTWRKLERSLVIRFREMFGEPPKRNKQGRYFRWLDEKRYFTLERLESVITKYSALPFGGK